MSNKYEELKNALSTLFHQLYFPIGGEIDEMEGIWMQENNEKKLLTMTTTKGFVTVMADGSCIQHDSIEAVMNLYVRYFSSACSAQEKFNTILNN